MSDSFLDGKVTLLRGDCLERLREIEPNSIDSCVTDPPYHLSSIVKRFGGDNAAPCQFGKDGAYSRASSGFMNKVWDGGDVAFRPETWGHVLRVLKPGAFIVAFSSSRTFHRMAVAIEDAGFITHPLVAWIFGQGFPKATRVQLPEWEGWRYGTQALKPALEPIYVGQKPFEKGLSGTQNIAKWGTGAINIDGCRVETAESLNGGAYAASGNRAPLSGDEREGVALGMFQAGKTAERDFQQPKGRWPANLIHDGSEEVVEGFPESKDGVAVGGNGNAASIYGTELEKHNAGNIGYGSSGSAARFFYTAKADADDRLGSKHPTVKPVSLISYLTRLVTPSGGVVLDPFAGTGTTGEAAFREGRRCILIEREPEYQADIERRMALVLAGPDERTRESIKARGLVQDAGPLFGGEAA